MLELLYPESTAPVLKGASVSKASEMLPVVDTNGTVLAQAPRTFCHGPHHPLHPVVHLHIINRKGQIYLQKRSATKKQYPNLWDTAVGGHVSYGEYIQEALFREAGEELGLYDFNPFFLDAYEFESEVERELVCAFAAVGDFKTTPDKDEVSEGRYWPIPDIEKSLGKGVFTSNFEYEFHLFKDRLLSLL